MGWQPFKSIGNLITSPVRIVGELVKGDVKDALGIAVNPFASQEATRDRTLKYAAGAATGALAGFAAGGPVGAVVGAAAGGISIAKSKGRPLDFVKSAAFGGGAGLIAGGAAGALGYAQYGGAAGEFGAGLVAGGKTATTAAEAATPSWIPKVGAIVKGAGTALTVGSMLASSAQDVQQPGQDLYPWEVQGPAQGAGQTFWQQPDGTVISGYPSTPQEKPASWTGPALLALGAIMLSR